ncbi:Leucyl aminopeptidase [Planctopirus limnophila DSM 3776]|uniref:Probable cytosol aminopeptidase n=2 Tax=Planctopirus limnophila TaxID=120 RepID=D5SX76_PLAL2|nr:Leucyl aminopeptidase [Planctopirus limnophila DSM 3776]
MSRQLFWSSRDDQMDSSCLFFANRKLKLLMNVKASSAPAANWMGHWLMVPISENPLLNSHLEALDQESGGLLTRLREAGDLPTKAGSLLHVKGVTGLGASRLLLVGLGAPEVLSTQSLDRALTAAFRSLTDKPNLDVGVVVPPAAILGSKTPLEFVSAAVTAANLGSVGQDLYRTERARHPLAALHVISSENMASAIERGAILGEAMNLTRELVNRPAQEVNPVTVADRCSALAVEYGLTCEIFDVPRLEAERMHSMLAVAKGSAVPARMVKLDYRGAKESSSHVALVGKGVTFDSGGLSLKPTDGMLTMKCDMAGAATVLGAIVAIARLKLPVNVTAYLGLVENMVSGTSYKLGDILTARNGVTIEVLNTDAEGRLVLADVLCYAVDQGAEKIVDLATLTGACVVALGEEVAGVFSNHDEWSGQVISAAKTVGEDMWPLPTWDLYDDLIKGDVGDIKNTGGRWGGAITAAKFLQRFVGGKPWVHLDIAGPAFQSSAKAWREAGATGYGVRTLVQLAESSVIDL